MVYSGTFLVYVSSSWTCVLSPSEKNTKKILLHFLLMWPSKNGSWLDSVSLSFFPVHFHLSSTRIWKRDVATPSGNASMERILFFLRISRNAIQWEQWSCRNRNPIIPRSGILGIYPGKTDMMHLQNVDICMHARPGCNPLVMFTSQS